MTPGKLILFLFVGAGLFLGMRFILHETRDEIIATRNFANAVLDGNSGVGYELAHGPGMGALVSQKGGAGRAAALARAGVKGEFRLAWYFLDEPKPNRDKTAMEVTGKQIIRYDPEGTQTIWGAEAFELDLKASLVKVNGRYKIQTFSTEKPPQRARR